MWTIVKLILGLLLIAYIGGAVVDFIFKAKYWREFLKNKTRRW